ncbi:hypothetical protein O3P69_020731 [Scylla paramamosain]|uniref:Uncharacterized protein n=1 Tax=Scylla paramamosain TaxID=85552 RepID=A0AAW0TRI9_SCYPA
MAGASWVGGEKGRQGERIEKVEYWGNGWEEGEREACEEKLCMEAHELRKNGHYEVRLWKSGRASVESLAAKGIRTYQARDMSSWFCQSSIKASQDVGHGSVAEEHPPDDLHEALPQLSSGPPARTIPAASGHAKNRILPMKENSHIKMVVISSFRMWTHPSLGVSAGELRTLRDPRVLKFQVDSPYNALLYSAQSYVPVVLVSPLHGSDPAEVSAANYASGVIFASCTPLLPVRLRMDSCNGEEKGAEVQEKWSWAQMQLCKEELCEEV